MLKDCIKVQEKKKRAGHVVVQRRQRNAQKSVQSCCFADQTYCLFAVLVAVALKTRRA